MKIKYRLSDGEILAMGAMPHLKADSGEGVEDFSGEIPGNISHFKRTGPGVIQEKSSDDKKEVDDAAAPATSKDIQDKFDTKVGEAAQIALLLEIVKTQFAGGIKKSILEKL